MIEDGRDGWVIPTNDALTLAKCLDRLGGAPGVVFDKRTAAREKALLHTWRRYHAHLGGCYEQIMADRKNFGGRASSGNKAAKGPA